MTFPFPFSFTPTVSTEFTASAVNTGSASTYTFTSHALGKPHRGRIIAVFVSMLRAGTGTTVTSVTVAGVSATQQAAVSAGTRHDFELWTAIVPDGATGNIVVNLSASPTRCGIGVFRIVGAGDPTPYDISTDDGTSASLSTTINVPPNGGLIAGFGGTRNSSAFTSTWTGMTEVYDEVVGGGTAHSGARLDIGSSETGKSILIANNLVTDLGAGLIVVSWRA